MKKTAIKEAILQLDTIIAMWQDKSNEMDFEHTLNVYKSELTTLLEKEKQDLMSAFAEGYTDHSRKEDLYPSTEYYYNQTFEQ